MTRTNQDMELQPPNNRRRVRASSSNNENVDFRMDVNTYLPSQVSGMDIDGNGTHADDSEQENTIDRPVNEGSAADQALQLWKQEAKEDEMNVANSTPDWTEPGPLPFEADNNAIEVVLDSGDKTPDWTEPGPLPFDAECNVVDIGQEGKDTANRPQRGNVKEWCPNKAVGNKVVRNIPSSADKNCGPASTLQATSETSNNRNYPSPVPRFCYQMYPLPEKSLLLELKICNTYNHHHIYQRVFEEGRWSKHSNSHSTDPSFHSHLSVHKVMLTEVRYYTTYPTSTVPRYFEQHQFDIAFFPSTLATFTVAMVKNDVLEFEHQFVHQHDYYFNDPSLEEHVLVSSITALTCTRTMTQCKLLGAKRDFYHRHFHEHIYTIFLDPPRRESTQQHKAYLYLGVKHEPPLSAQTTASDQVMSDNIRPVEPPADYKKDHFCAGKPHCPCFKI